MTEREIGGRNKSAGSVLDFAPLKAKRTLGRASLLIAVYPACGELRRAKLVEEEVKRGSVLAIQHFAARGGVLVQSVHLVCLVFLLCLVQRTKYTR